MPSRVARSGIISLPRIRHSGNAHPLDAGNQFGAGVGMRNPPLPRPSVDNVFVVHWGRHAHTRTVSLLCTVCMAEVVDRRRRRFVAPDGKASQNKNYAGLLGSDQDREAFPTPSNPLLEVEMAGGRCHWLAWPRPQPQ